MNVDFRLLTYPELFILITLLPEPPLIVAKVSTWALDDTIASLLA